MNCALPALWVVVQSPIANLVGSILSYSSLACPGLDCVAYALFMHVYVAQDEEQLFMCILYIIH